MKIGVIGAGAAGLIAGAFAAKGGASVDIIDRNEKTGKNAARAAKGRRYSCHRRQRRRRIGQHRHYTNDYDTVKDITKSTEQAIVPCFLFIVIQSVGFPARGLFTNILKNLFMIGSAAHYAVVKRTLKTFFYRVFRTVDFFRYPIFQPSHYRTTRNGIRALLTVIEIFKSSFFSRRQPISQPVYPNILLLQK